ncbi:helix-turn-helix transcriptional regulator [bacterium]|nr:helix-turn-helix transcriptional regulator [bacterium]
MTNIDIREEFGKRVKFLRKCRKMSQWDLSRQSGIDRAYISEVENGRSAATIDLINRMAKAMDLHPAEFLVFGKETPKISYDGKDLADSIAAKLKK